MGVCPNTAEFIRQDLQAAGLPLEDSDGNEICFHSLRNSYITFLANSGNSGKSGSAVSKTFRPEIDFQFVCTELKISRTNSGELFAEFGKYFCVQQCPQNQCK
jgi:hypothetical protein